MAVINIPALKIIYPDLVKAWEKYRKRSQRIWAKYPAKNEATKNECTPSK